MRKVGVVARREFLSTVRRRSYLVVTLGIAVLPGAMSESRDSCPPIS